MEEESGLKLAHIAGTLDLAHKDADRASKVPLSYEAVKKQGVK